MAPPRVDRQTRPDGVGWNRANVVTVVVAAIAVLIAVLAYTGNLPPWSEPSALERIERYVGTHEAQDYYGSARAAPGGEWECEPTVRMDSGQEPSPTEPFICMTYDPDVVREWGGNPRNEWLQCELGATADGDVQGRPSCSLTDTPPAHY